MCVNIVVAKWEGRGAGAENLTDSNAALAVLWGVLVGCVLMVIFNAPITFIRLSHWPVLRRGLEHLSHFYWNWSFYHGVRVMEKPSSLSLSLLAFQSWRCSQASLLQEPLCIRPPRENLLVSTGSAMLVGVILATPHQLTINELGDGL